MMTFQEMILKLTQFWAQHGCAIHQGYDLEVGAGTFNPATFLRCLGPEPYSAVYVEPSRRPKDGRYGENPNRVQFYHQMQVIMKPSPKNIQDLYLKSLEAIGLDLSQHDIRFVHDDWENPTIGAWGLGWEIWLDGMEVTQFTYFQAIGGLPVSPVSGEITYGLERLAMYIQGVGSMFDLKWNDTISYGDIYKRNEWEWSRYNFVEANAKMWFQHFEDFENESKRLIEEHLPIPAYDFIMKASHAFNMLDARGVISVTERTGYISRIRTLAKLLAESYVHSREKQQFPLLRTTNTIETEQHEPIAPNPKFDPEEKEDFLLEIGSEELPATFVPIGARNLQQQIEKFLEEQQLSFEKIAVYATPRRLAILVSQLAGGTHSKKIERKGPALKAAFDEQGEPTQAGIGFFRSLNKEPCHKSDLENGKVAGITIEHIKQVPYLLASYEQQGQSTRALLAEHLPKIILSIDFPKKMRWSDLQIEYARPLRWIVALYGAEIIPFKVGNLSTSNKSFGHRQLAPQEIALARPADYLSALRNNWVMADIEERRASIEKQLENIEKIHASIIAAKEKVMPQVLFLVEWPFVTAATFDERFLEAPQEVLISEMVEHQKYFPLLHQSGSLNSIFAIVCNNHPNDLIRAGNQRALCPRLADGMFLYEQDLKIPLERFNEKLKTITFQKDLGSVWNKVERLISFSEKLHRHLPICDLNLVLRAATLSKADLASELVGEFPELQGIVGKIYATKQKENPDVAAAIDEQWMPRGEKAPLAQTACGTLLSISEKVDNLTCCFAIGMKPTSSSDPYALRRQSIGLLRMLIQGSHHISLRSLFKQALDVLHNSPVLSPNWKAHIQENNQQIVEEILQFLMSRFRTILADYGFAKDEIEAVLSSSVDDPADLYKKLQALHAFRSSNVSGLSALCELHTRCKKILASQSNKQIFQLEPKHFKDEAEIALFNDVQSIQNAFHTSLIDRREPTGRRWPEAFALLTRLQIPVHNLFDKVKIIDDDATVRSNRLALLQEVQNLCEELADFSKIQL